MDLAVPGHGLRHSRAWLVKDVVLTAMPEQHAASPFQLLNQINPFQTISRSSTLRMPGRSPLPNSW